MQKIRQMVPWTMAAGRALMGPVIVIGDRCGWSGLALAAMVVSALVSDIFDGVLARRWRVDTAAVRLFDSMCDMAFYVCVGVALWFFQPQLLFADMKLLCVLLAVEAANFAANFAKYGRPASYHSYLAKAWGLALASAIAAAFLTGHAGMLMRVALWMGVASNVETIAMSLMLPVWRRDVKTLAEALRIRKEICGCERKGLPDLSTSQDCGRFARLVERAITWAGTAIIAGLSLMATSAFAAQPGKPDTLQDRIQAGQILSQETQARGYWVDPATGLMWAAKDNGKDLRWKQAVKYCRNLRLDGRADWRLPTLQELEGVSDRSAESPGLAGHGKTRPFSWHAKGGLYLTGDEWSSNLRLDDRQKPIWAWHFDFINLQASDDDGNMGFWDSYDKRALCVRSADAAVATPPTR